MLRDARDHGVMINRLNFKFLLNSEHKKCEVEDIKLFALAQNVADELMETVVKRSEEVVVEPTKKMESHCSQHFSSYVVPRTIETFSCISEDIQIVES